MILTKEDKKELQQKMDKLLLYLIHNDNIECKVSRRGKSIILDNKITL